MAGDGVTGQDGASVAEWKGRLIAAVRGGTTDPAVLAAVRMAAAGLCAAAAAQESRTTHHVSRAWLVRRLEDALQVVAFGGQAQPIIGAVLEEVRAHADLGPV